MAGKEFRATPIYVVPIFASLLVSISCAVLISQYQKELIPMTILPETGHGPIFNAAIFVLAAAFSATMISFLLKRGVKRFIRLLIGVAFAALTFSLVIFYSELVRVIMNMAISFTFILLLALSATVFVVLEVLLKKGRSYEIIILVFGGATGTLLGASIPAFSAILILLFLAVYDVIAVYRGPVGKIASTGLEHLPGISFAFKNIRVGLGDLIFYSMLVSRMFLSFGWEVCIAATFGVLLGAFLSFKMVEKKAMFPGLPFSIMLGLAASFIVLMMS